MKPSASLTCSFGNAVYLVLSKEDRKQGFVQPLRTAYRHKMCDTVTTMGPAIAETYARDPWFYGATYCVECSMHKPLEQFTWEPDGQEMNPTNWSDDQLQLVRDRQKESVVSRFSFEVALGMIKDGAKVARTGWNGKDMFIFLVDGSTFEVNRKPLLGIYPEGTEINYHAHIDMRTADGMIVPWLASQTDLLAEDWTTVE